MFQAMTAQIQHGMMAVQAPAPAPRPRLLTAPRIKTRDPDLYDGNDPSKLQTFLSQCKLAFLIRPDDFREDTVKIMFAISIVALGYRPTVVRTQPRA